MMFGWKDSFEYAECLECGTIQIVAVPENLSKYYPDDYYSLSNEGPRGVKASSARRLMTKLALEAPGMNWFARKMLLKYPFLFWARTAKAQVDSAFLDVGCGSGRLLRRMQKSGFSNLHGVDPYAPGDVTEAGFTIRRSELSSLTGRFDLIILSHVLEHVADPVETLRLARSLLNDGGTVLVRVPIAGSYHAEFYKEFWYNLDPPRHLVVPSVQGMRLIAQKAGLEVHEIEFDCLEDSALYSEAYKNGVSMKDAVKPEKHVRNVERAKAQVLNEAGRGDLAAFFLKSASR